MKPCTRCGEVKPLDAFHLNPLGRMGRASRCKPCIVAAVAEWRKDHRAEHLAASKRWRARYPEKQRRATAAWLERNAARKQQTNRAYHERHREREREYAARWRATEHGGLLHRAKEEHRRARKAAATVGQVDLAAIFKRDGGRCWICHRSLHVKQVHFDHVIPLSRGGAHGPENIRVTCASCNVRKSNHIPTPELIARVHDATLAAVA